MAIDTGKLIHVIDLGRKPARVLMYTKALYIKAGYVQLGRSVSDGGSFRVTMMKSTVMR